MSCERGRSCDSHLDRLTKYHALATFFCHINIALHPSLSMFSPAGDLPLMWIRDSAVQISVLLPRIAKRPALRRVIEGAIRAQAFYITQV